MIERTQSGALARVLGALGRVTPSGDGYSAHCPAHDDRDPSLSITDGGDKVLVCCHAGCTQEAVLSALEARGIARRDLFEDEPKPKREIVVRYQYRDENCALLFEAVRYSPKGFSQRRPDGNGGWLYKLGDVRRVLYRLPELVAADASLVVYVTEGEKDADALAGLDLVATCNPMGAGKWRNEYSESLHGRTVAILPDRDKAGHEHALQVARSLHGIAAEVRIVPLPGPGKDASDWLADGGTVAQLAELFEDAAPFDPEDLEAIVQTLPLLPSEDAPKEHWIRPEIHIEGGELPAIVEAAESALLESPGDRVYQRGGLLVRVAPIESEQKGKTRRQSGALLVRSIEPDWLVYRLTRAADFRSWYERTKEWKPTDCPAKVAKTLLANSGAWRAPVLRGLVEAPTLRGDGSILAEPGYDEESGLLFDPGSETFAPIPETPSREEALAALLELRDLVHESPFVEEADESVALAAILTALVRRSLPSAPAFGFSAPKMRSGKTALAETVGLLATGRQCAVLSQADKAEEERKRLLAVLLEGDPVLLFDNLERPFGSDVIAQALTQPSIRDRLLGASKMATAPTCATILATGNNLVFAGDTSSRVLRCDLDPRMERPEERDFERDLFAYVRQNRGRLVASALTILRAYHVAGRPELGLSRWAGFAEWSGWVRSSLVWLGMADPCDTRRRIEAEDPVRRDLVGLLSAWHGVFGEERRTAADVRHRIEGDALSSEEMTLRDAAFAVAGDGRGLRLRAFGRYLSSHQNRIEGGYRIERAGDRQGSAVWRVVHVEEISF